MSEAGKYIQEGLNAVRRGNMAAAREHFARAVALEPQAAAGHANLGLALGMLGRDAEAAAALGEAARLCPQKAEYHDNLGVALERSGRLREAAEAYRRAIGLKNGFAAAHSHLGNVLRQLGDLESAAAHQSEALALDASDGQINSQLAGTLFELGDAAGAIACYRRAAEAYSATAATHSNLIFAMLHDAGSTAEQIAQEGRQWNSRYGKPKTGSLGPCANGPSANRPLRIGYVSPDFREHAVCTFVEPLLEHHDRSQFEIFCYSDVSRPDATTDRLKNLPLHWRDWNGLSGEQAADGVRQDRIDILVDLRGHGAGNRLPVFARKPAPVQVTMIGFLETTGLSAMDFRITDPWHDPPGMPEQFNSERLLRLGRSIWCYRPAPQCPPVAPPRAIKNGYITFGSLCRAAKLTPEALLLWSQVLARVPESRLLLTVPGGDRAAGLVKQKISQAGIRADRLMILDKTRTRCEYLSRLSEIDIALDTFPFNGVTTTCDGLWMGTPTITLAGKTSVSRAGVSILSAAGLGQFICATPSEYVQCAVGLACDTERLTRIRGTLRDQMNASPLRDERGFAQEVEFVLQETLSRGGKQKPAPGGKFTWLGMDSTQ